MRNTLQKFRKYVRRRGTIVSVRVCRDVSYNGMMQEEIYLAAEIPHNSF